MVYLPRMNEPRPPVPGHGFTDGVGGEVLAFIWETAKIVLISLAIIVPIRYYLVQPFFVKGESMLPNFQDKDYIIVDKLSYRLSEPRRGDVVIFRYPRDPQEYFIKRIIALPGETILIHKGKIIIYNELFPNGGELDESLYLPKGLEPQLCSIQMPYRLDQNEFFVMGDNRDHSSDSRCWGPVNESFLSGRAWLRLWPLEQSFFIERLNPFVERLTEPLR